MAGAALTLGDEIRVVLFVEDVVLVFAPERPVLEQALLPIEEDDLILIAQTGHDPAFHLALLDVLDVVNVCPVAGPGWPPSSGKSLWASQSQLATSVSVLTMNTWSATMSATTKWVSLMRSMSCHSPAYSL